MALSLYLNVFISFSADRSAGPLYLLFILLLDYMFNYYKHNNCYSYNTEVFTRYYIYYKHLLCTSSRAIVAYTALSTSRTIAVFITTPCGTAVPIAPSGTINKRFGVLCCQQYCSEYCYCH